MASSMLKNSFPILMCESHTGILSKKVVGAKWLMTKTDRCTSPPSPPYPTPLCVMILRVYTGVWQLRGLGWFLVEWAGSKMWLGWKLSIWSGNTGSRLNQCRLVCHTSSQVSLRFNILRPNVFKDQSSVSVLTANYDGKCSHYMHGFWRCIQDLRLCAWF